jgi:hypothetical protein
MDFDEILYEHIPKSVLLNFYGIYDNKNMADTQTCVKYEQHWHCFQNAVTIMTKETQEHNFCLTLLIYRQLGAF